MEFFSSHSRRSSLSPDVWLFSCTAAAWTTGFDYTENIILLHFLPLLHSRNYWFLLSGFRVWCCCWTAESRGELIFSLYLLLLHFALNLVSLILFSSSRLSTGAHFFEHLTSSSSSISTSRNIDGSASSSNTIPNHQRHEPSSNPIREPRQRVCDETHSLSQQKKKRMP